MSNLAGTVYQTDGPTMGISRIVIRVLSFYR